MPLPADADWYAAQLRPNCLNMAVSGLARQGFDVFLPKIVSDRKTASGVGLPWVPLFPGYLFVRFDPARPAWRAINSTRGVTKLVSFGDGGPRPVPRGLIDELQARCGEDGVMRAPEDLAPGDRVRVLRGPFAHYVSEIARIEPDRRAWMLIEILGRTARMTVKLDDLARA